MKPNDAFLDRIRVAEPCDASWSSMDGDEQKRFCGECKLHVYNFSAMRRADAEALLRGANGRVCGRFYRRADGTVITQDCGPLRRAIQRRLRFVRLCASAVFAFLASAVSLGCGGQPNEVTSTGPTAGSTTDIPSKPAPQKTPAPIELMGDIDVAPDLGQRMGRVCLPQQHPKPAPKTPDDRKQP